MADDDRNHRKDYSDRDRTPDWHETCIGIWSKSTKGHHVNDGEHDKICNGVSVVRIHGKPKDPDKLKLSKTRGLQIIITIETEKAPHPPPKPHDHTYISVERVEADSKYASNRYNSKVQREQKSDDSDVEPAKEQVPNLTRRVMDVMLMKKTNLERNVEHYKKTGVKLTDICDGIHNTCSKCCETTARLISYCHPVDKINQMYGFIANRIKNVGKWTDDDDKRRK